MKQFGRPRGKFHPAHGREFDISLDDLVRYQTSRTRDRLAYLILAGAAGATAIAALAGFSTGSFTGVQNVWAATGPIIGAVLGYYFHRTHKDSS